MSNRNRSEYPKNSSEWGSPSLPLSSYAFASADLAKGRDTGSSASNIHESGASDEANFILGCLDSQLKLLVDSVEKHLASFSVENGGRVDRIIVNAKLTTHPNVPSLHGLRSSMSQQAGAVRATLRHLENRVLEQMESLRSDLRRNVDRESELRQRLCDLRHSLVARGMKVDELQAPQYKRPESADFERELRDLMLVRNRVVDELSQIESIDKLKLSA